jgi:hypothetical protein
VESFGDVLQTLTRIREAAEGYMDKRDLAGDGWSEETVTDLSVTEGRPTVKVTQFNRNQEGRPGRLGADYLWWWLDAETAECAGPIFTNLPDDQGHHFPQPYYQHVLQGLRTAPPDYLLDLQAGNSLPPALTNRLAGIVTITLPGRALL